MIYCKCSIPNGGYCERHNCNKTASWVKLCNTNIRYFNLWELGKGPGQHFESQKLTLKELLVRQLEYLRKPCGGCKNGSKTMEQSLLDEILKGDGVGSQLWGVFSRLGIEHKPDCPCLLLADIMNQLGPEGCKENRDKIIRLLKKNKKKYGWAEHLKAGANAIVLGWAFKINPLDPLPSLLDMAINLAEEQQQCQSSGLTV